MQSRMLKWIEVTVGISKWISHLPTWMHMLQAWFFKTWRLKLRSDRGNGGFRR